MNIFMLPELREQPSVLSDAEWRGIIEGLGLSLREVQILQHVFQGEKQLTIAHRLRISPHTVHTHLHRLYLKLGANSREDAILAVFREYVAWIHREGLHDAVLPQPAHAGRAAA